MPTTLRLLVDAAAVYTTFITWALLQERIGTKEYEHVDNTESKARFEYPALLLALQAFLCTIASFTYLYLRNNNSNGGDKYDTSPTSKSTPTSWAELVGFNAKSKSLLPGFIKISIFNSLAGPLAFVSLKHVSYPTVVLAKSCKLVPVMLTNVLIYRRKFSLHKYFVVALVTLGIIVFTMPRSAGKSHDKQQGVDDETEQSPIIGAVLLMLSLFMDGLVNSSQDEIFSRHSINGVQMMFWMNACSLILLTTSLIIPLPDMSTIISHLLFEPSLLVHDVYKTLTSVESVEIISAFEFIRTHPSVLLDMLSFAGCGSIGQIFIFDVLQHFGSLTLVTLTLTRKLLTMLLSVIVFGHPLKFSQWIGVAFVFAGLGVESYMKAFKSKATTDKSESFKKQA